MARTGAGSIYTRKAVEIFRKSMKICSFVSITVSYQKKKPICMTYVLQVLIIVWDLEKSLERRNYSD